MKRIIKMLILSIGMVLSTTVSYAQWGGILGGVLQGAAERWIDKSNFSSQDKETMKDLVGSLSNEVNANQGARNAAKDAYEGNYTGAVLQGVQTVINAAGNNSYDTYLNSANTINDAEREYRQNLQNGMDPAEALEIRNKAIGYSAAESIVELQDRLAREKIRKAREKRELERQSWESSNDYMPTGYSETNTYSETNNPSETNTETSFPNLETLDDVLIAYVNTTDIINAMPDMNEARKELEQYSNELQSQLQAMYEELQTKFQYYQSNFATMSNTIKQIKEEELNDTQNRIQQFEADAARELDAKRAELMNPLLEKLQNTINTVSRDNKLAAVFDTSSSTIMYYGEDTIDITYMVMKELGIQ